MTDILLRLRHLQALSEDGHEPVAYVRDIWRCAADEIGRLRKALDEIADPNLALLAETKAKIARKALNQQVKEPT